MVELAVDAPADRVLAELSENRRRADRVGRRESAAMVGRADLDHNYGGAGARAPEPDALVPGHRLLELPADLGVDRAHAVSLPLHGVGLFRIPGAGDFACGLFQRARRAVGASRAVADNDAGDFSRAATELGVARILRSGRCVLLLSAEHSIRGTICRERIRCGRGDPVRVLLPDLGRHADQPRGLLRADVAAVRRHPQLDMIGHLNRKLLCAIFLCAIFAITATPRGVLAADQKNLLLNGDFKKGSEDQPDSWRTEAWINSPEGFQPHCISYPDKPGRW